MPLRTNLIKYMKLREISIKELSKNTDISEPTLKRLRTVANTNPTLDVLIRLTKALDVKINDLVNCQESIETYILGVDLINPQNSQKEFVLIFQEDIFDIKAGTRTLFKKYNKENAILTKYILKENKEILKVVDAENLLFMDHKNTIFSLQKERISAYILKQLYEVSYV